jgi:hypothetical protein
MLKLARNLFSLGFLVVLVMTLLLLFSPHDNENYMAAAVDKHRLLYSVPSPRVILIGGSNTAFSVDSQMLAEHFGMPVINMGLNVDLGLRYMLNEVRPTLRDGDILLIFPEYAHFSDIPLDGKARELGTLIKLCPECISGINTPLQAYNVMSGIFQASESDILRAVGKPVEHSVVYERKGFNAWGDMVAHLDQPTPSGFANSIPKIKVSSSSPAIELLNTFYESLDAAGVDVFLIYPAIPINIYKAQQENFNTLDEFIKTGVEIPVVGAPQDFIYARKLFYDTTYHLNREGRRLHTNHVIDMLDPFFQR